MKKILLLFILSLGFIAPSNVHAINTTLSFPTYSKMSEGMFNVAKVAVKIAELDGHFLLDYPKTALITHVAAFYALDSLHAHLKTKYKNGKDYAKAVLKNVGSFGAGVLATLAYQQLHDSLLIN